MTDLSRYYDMGHYPLDSGGGGAPPGFVKIGRWVGVDALNPPEPFDPGDGQISTTGAVQFTVHGTDADGTNVDALMGSITPGTEVWVGNFSGSQSPFTYTDQGPFKPTEKWICGASGTSWPGFVPSDWPNDVNPYPGFSFELWRGAPAVAATAIDAPHEFSVADVRRAVDDHPDACAVAPLVLELEREGKARVSLIDWLVGFIEGCEEPDDE